MEEVFKDRLKAKCYTPKLRRFLEHPILYTHILCRNRCLHEGSTAVVIPAKNRAPYLEKAVLSSIHQTRPPQEVYIIVDPSHDGTEAKAMALSRRFNEVKCILNNKDRGVAESRNQGIVASTSDYIMFLDSDDVLKPRYIEKVAALLDQNSKVGMGYSDYVEFGDRNKLIKLPPFDPRLLLVDCFFGWPVTRRTALEEAGGFDSEQIFEDWELFIRVIGKGWSAMGVSEPLYMWRIHELGRDAVGNQRRKEAEDMIYQKHRLLYDKYKIGRTKDGKWINTPSPWR